MGLCGKLEQLVNVEGLMEQLEKDYYSIGSKALVRLLTGSLREHSIVQYLVTRSAYFEIDMDFHNTVPGAIFFSKTGLFCSHTRKRLEEIESVGRSDLAWRAREIWLDHSLKIIKWPWDEMDGPEKQFFVEFDRIKKFYTTAEDKRNLMQWTNRAEKLFFEAAESESIEGSNGKIKKQHLETLQRWIKQMREGL